VDSKKLIALVDSEKVKARSRCRLGNRHGNTFQRWRMDLEAPQPLLTTKKWTKQLPKVTRGFRRARSPCWLRKSQQKWSRWRLGNHHQNTFLRWRVDLEAPQLLLTTKKWTKQLPKVMHGFGRARSPCWVRNIQRKQSRCRLRNYHRNSFQRWRVDSEALVAPFDIEKVNKNGVGADSEILNETPSIGDAWIREST